MSHSAFPIPSGKGAGHLIARADGRDVVEPDFLPVTDVERNLLDFVIELAGIGSDAVNQLTEGFVGNLLLPCAQAFESPRLRLVSPVRSEEHTSELQSLRHL